MITPPAGSRIGVGDVVGGKYSLLRLVAAGGMAAVYEAENTWTGRRVAIKLLLPELSANPEAIERFRQEARVMTRLAHPNVVDVLDLGQEDSSGSLYIVSEFLRGMDLRDLLQREKRLSPAEAIGILIPVMGALVSAHAHGVVHRDLKPENVFLVRDRSRGVVPKLIDFGVAKVLGGDASPRIRTRVGVIVGTPEYLPPELMRGGDPPDGRADVWSIGVILYELLAGRLPWFEAGEDRHPFEVAVKIVTDPVPRIEKFVPDIPPALAAIVHTALEREIDKRYPSMRAFVAAILECPIEGKGPSATQLGIAPVHSMVPAKPPPASKGQRSNTDVVGPEGEPEEIDADMLSEADSETQPARASVIPPGTKDLGELVEARAIGNENRTLIEFPIAGLPPALDGAPDAEKPSSSNPPSADTEDPRTSDAPAPPSLETAREKLRESEEALRGGALERAIKLARQGYAAASEDPELAGACRLVQAVARRWRGNVAAAERSALKAFALLPAGTPRSLVLIGELAHSYGSLGRNDQFDTLVDRLRSARTDNGHTDEFVIAACRVAIQLYWAGWPENAITVSGWATADGNGERAPIVRAWRQKLRAVQANHEGDVSRALADFTAAAESFALAGDVPNNCMERSNVAEALMDLGAFRQAREMADETLKIAERLGLFTEGWLRCNLGVCMSRLGDLEGAFQMATSAVDVCARQGDRRTEGWARIYRSRIALRSGALEDAERDARAAIEIGAAMPPVRANASAALAAALGRGGRMTDAMEAADAAANLLDAMGGRGEGEAYVRLTCASVLASAGRKREADEAMKVALERLVSRAAKISDPTWRRSFLENVPEHAATLEADPDQEVGS